MSRLSKISILAVAGFSATALILFMLSQALRLDNEAAFEPDPPNVAYAFPSCKAAEDLANLVRAKIKANQSCNDEADCAVLHLGCPFGCVTAVNRLTQADVLEAHEQYVAYIENGLCGRCIYGCRSYRNPGLVCERNTCKYVQLSEPDEAALWESSTRLLKSRQDGDLRR